MSVQNVCRLLEARARHALLMDTIRGHLPREAHRLARFLLSLPNGTALLLLFDAGSGVVSKNHTVDAGQMNAAVDAFCVEQLN